MVTESPDKSKIKSAHIKKGEKGEEAAAGYLQGKGYNILHRNYHCKYGEIDIIALYEEFIVFIEVRSRSNDLNAAFSSVSYRKRIKLIRSALDYITNNERFEKFCIRFDVIGIITDRKTGLYRITHLEDAFRVDDLDEYL